MRRPANTAFFVLALASIAGATAAASGLTVELNHSRRVVLHGAVANVIVGDPLVADVSMVDGHSVIVQGRGFGSTEVTVLDRAGRTLFESRVMVVTPDDGRVTIHRGVAAADYACSPRCQPLPVSKDAGGAAPGGGGNALSTALSTVAAPAPASP